MKLLFDENLPRELAAALRLMHFEVWHVRDELPPQSADEAVVALAKRHGAIVITRDRSFHEHELIAGALRADEVTVITVTFPRGYDDFEAIRDALLVLLEDEDRIPVREGTHIRCSVRPPKSKHRRRGRPSLTFTVPMRRRR